MCAGTRTAPETIAWCAIAAIPGPLNPGALLSGLSGAAWAVIEPRTPAHDRTKGGAADAIRRPARPFSLFYCLSDIQ
ncbi:hypothetical protein GCM10009834_26450 [Streptomonospora arabica]